MSHLNKSWLPRTRMCMRIKMHDDKMYDKSKKNKDKNKKIQKYSRMRINISHCSEI